MKTIFSQLIPALIILLFVYAAVSKLLNFSMFHDQLYNQSFSHHLADVLQYLVPFSELIASGLLLFRKSTLAGLGFSLVLLILFTGYIILVLLHWWNRESCPCGGILTGLGWPGHLIINVIFIFLNLIAISIKLKERRLTVSDK